MTLANPSMETASSAMDSEHFRALGHAVVDQLADYLRGVCGREKMPVLPWTPPSEMAASWPDVFPRDGGGNLSDIVERVVHEANHLHHPHYIGHQVPGPLPAAALCELVANLLNNGMAVYEMGTSGTVMERHIVRWMAKTLGLPPEADGFITSGGSAGNLTALLAARSVKAVGGDERPLSVLVSDQAHYSVLRAVKTMGWGGSGAIAIPSDDTFHMRADALAEGLARAESMGRRVVGVVASACTTPTGTFDPLPAIADFCEARELWLHVDAAHGAPACLSEKYRHYLDGIERADSIVYDAHKMMLIPALATAVIFRNGAHSYRAFEERPSYLLSGDPGEEWFNLGHRTLECTKRMACFKVYAMLSCYGTRFFGDYVTSRFDLARRFAKMIEDAPDFELPVEPESNIVCFRYLPAEPSDLDAVQARIRKTIIESGSFYIVQTRLPAGLFLRVTVINPLTTESDLAALLDAVREVGGRTDLK